MLSHDPLKSSTCLSEDKFVVIDVETRSALDLKRVGAFRYAAHPSTDAWCAAFAVDGDPVELWRKGEPAPAAVLAAVRYPEYEWIAHNASFERAILQHILTPRYGWPVIPIERWRCTMAMCQALALPPALAKVAAVLKLPHQKAPDGVMHLMSKPRAPRCDEDPAGGPYWFDDPERLEALYAYCMADVECERDLFLALPGLSEAEQRLWEIDQVINDRGFYIDGQLIPAALAIVADAERAAQMEIKEVTEGAIETTNQVAKLVEWLAARGCALEDLQKDTLVERLREAS
jgi:DNA polymerase